MGETVTTKTCRMCCNEIDSRAMVCPYCASKQGWFFRDTVWVVLSLVFFGSMLVAAWLVPRNMFGKPGESFFNYRHQVEITQSRMFFGAPGQKERNVFVVGILKNNSDVPWREVQIGVEWLNGKGEVIDADWDDGFRNTVMPRGEMAFKVKGTVHHPEDEYASFKVYVRDARDARGRFPFD